MTKRAPTHPTSGQCCDDQIRANLVNVFVLATPGKEGIKHVREAFLDNDACRIMFGQRFLLVYGTHDGLICVKPMVQRRYLAHVSQVHA